MISPLNWLKKTNRRRRGSVSVVPCQLQQLERREMMTAVMDVSFAAEYQGRENVLLATDQTGTQQMIEDGVVKWQIAEDSSVYFFRWESADRPRTLLHWSKEAGKTIVADNVQDWTVKDDSAFFLQSVSQDRENVLRQWSPKSDAVMIEDNVVEWKMDDDRSVYFFRWESADRPDTLLHWSEQSGKSIVADQVSTWNVNDNTATYLTHVGTAGKISVGSNGMVYVLSNGGLLKSKAPDAEWENLAPDVVAFENKRNSVSYVQYDGESGTVTVNGSDYGDRLRAVKSGQTISITLGSTEIGSAPDSELVAFDTQTSPVNRIVFHGNSGNDQVENQTDIPSNIHGGADDDTLRGGTANDFIHGNGDHDEIFGGPGLDDLWGGAGNDTINGGGDSDQLRGDNGNDLLVIDSLDNVVDGLGGEDTVLISGTDQNDDWYFSGDANQLFVSSPHEDWAALRGIERIVADGGDGNDRIHNDTDIESVMYGRDGNDTLTGGGSNDLLFGGADADYIRGRGANDTVRGGAGNDTLFGDLNDKYDAATQDDVFGGGDTDAIEGSRAIEGYAFHDDVMIISGTDENNEIVFDKNGEHMIGLRGANRAWSNPSYIEIHGFDGDDLIYNDTDVASVMYGGGGNDTLTGGGSNDSLFGGADDDYIRGGGANDSIRGGAGNDTLFGDLNDKYDAATRDEVAGEDGTDVIEGSRAIDGYAFNDNVMYIGGTGANDHIVIVNNGDHMIGIQGANRAWLRPGTIEFDSGGGNDRLENHTNIPARDSAGSIYSEYSGLEESIQDGELRGVSSVSNGATVSENYLRQYGLHNFDVPQVGMIESWIVIIGTSVRDQINIIQSNGSYLIRDVVNNRSWTYSSSQVGGRGFLFFGLQGNDTLGTYHRLDRHVVAYGGSGDDSLAGGRMGDRLVGEGGSDTIFGNAGKDFLVGGLGGADGKRDLLHGDGSDSFFGTAEDYFSRS